MPDSASINTRVVASAAALDAIRARVSASKSGWAATDADITADLNAPSIDNASPRGITSKPYSPLTLVEAMSGASVARLVASPILGGLIDAVYARDDQAVGMYIEIMAMSGVVTADERTALDAIRTATEPDPQWTAKLSWSRSVLGRSVSADDVAQARVK